MDLLNIEQSEIHNLVKFTQAMIEFDNSTLIAEVNKIISKISNLIITEDMLPDIKKDRASLNKLIKMFDDSRKQIKNEYNKPLAEFESKIKDICGIIENQIAYFDTQTQEFEIKRRTAKKEQVEKIIQDVCLRKNLDELKYSSQLTFIDRYYNVSEKDYMIIKDLEQRADQILIVQKNEELAEELRISKIKNREMLLANFNATNNVTALYSSYTIEEYPNDQDAMTGLNLALEHIKYNAAAREAVIIEKRSINLATTETTYDKPMIDYVEVRIYVDMEKVLAIMDKADVKFTIINQGKKALTIQECELPF